MQTIKQTAEAVKYFQMAIEEMKEALYQKIEQDEEYLKFKQKWYRESTLCFVYFKDSMEFLFYDMPLENEKRVCTDFFKITKNGEIEFHPKNTFDDIKQAAKEAQKITRKFL